MKRLLLQFTLILVLFFSCKTDVDVAVMEEDAPYAIYQLSGFEVRVEKIGLDNNPQITQEAIELMKQHLTQITNLGLNESIMESLQSVVIFMDWSTTQGAAVYHPNASWLFQNGYSTDKAQNVEISNMRHYIAWTKQNQPFMVLHELAHAYHDRVLGFDNVSVLTAYYNVISNNLYLDVPYNDGFSIGTQDKAYALNNEIEYFAELTEAYFGQNDYFPFIKTELATYDSVGFKMIEEVWEQ